ncbi:MAG: hypothetical protein HYR67_16415 [Bacteroidetes bacterium]|nr:hypothetical protein [Bacteroidota bacterium]
MKNYKISIDPDALQDIQQATDWYNEQLPGLGSLSATGKDSDLLTKEKWLNVRHSI